MFFLIDLCNIEPGDMVEGGHNFEKKWERMKKYKSKILDTTIHSSIDVLSLF